MIRVSWIDERGVRRFGTFVRWDDNRDAVCTTGARQYTVRRSNLTYECK